MEVDKEEAPAGTGASDRRSDLILCGRSQNPHGKYTRPQVETVDDLGWGSIPIAYLFTEEKSDGFWRLQTEDAHLKKLMKPRVWNARSPWHLTGRSSTTCIFRRRFSSTRNALQSIRGILDRGASECSFVRDKSKLLFKIVSRAKNGRKAVHTHG
jgi:hypothetical protein